MSKGRGKFYFRGQSIWVCGSVDGVFYRKATGKKLTSANKLWVKNTDPLRVLTEILEKENPNQNFVDANIENFGLYVIELTHSKRSKATQDDYVRILHKKIVPFFSLIKMSNIKPLHIVQFLHRMQSEVCGDRVKRIKSVLSLILEYAAEEGLIDKQNNPIYSKIVKDVDINYTPENNNAYDFEETALMLQNAKGWFKVFLDLSFKLGCRPGELMGLKWEDINLETGRIHIKRTIYKGIIKEINEHKKNKKHNRILYLQPESLKLMQSYYEFRESDIWVFINKDGKYFKESKTINDYHVKPLLKQLKLEYKPLYSARRAYATIMNFAGEDFAEIQKVMGHNIGSEITKKHYIDPLALKEKHHQEKAKKAEELFKMVVGNE